MAELPLSHATEFAGFREDRFLFSYSDSIQSPSYPYASRGWPSGISSPSTNVSQRTPGSKHSERTDASDARQVPLTASNLANCYAQAFPATQVRTSRFQVTEDRVRNPCKVFIGGIGQGTVESTIRQHFGQFGIVLCCVIVTHRKSGKSRGFGFVTYADEQAAQAAVNAKHKIDEILVECRQALPRDEARFTAPHDSLFMPTKIFVGGIPDTVQEEQFKEFFQQFGLVKDVSLAYDKSNHRPRGFGFVVFTTPEAASSAVGRHTFHGKTIEAKHAVPRDVPKLPRNRGGSRRTQTELFNTRRTESQEIPLWQPYMPKMSPHHAHSIDLVRGFSSGEPLDLSASRLSMRTYGFDSGMGTWNSGMAHTDLGMAFQLQPSTPHMTMQQASGMMNFSPNTAMVSASPLGQLLLTGNDSGFSLAPHSSSLDISSSNDDPQLTLVADDYSNNSLKELGLLKGSDSGEWTPNFFFYNTNATASPIHAVPTGTFVPVMSPLAIPMQPRFNGMISMESICSPAVVPSSPTNIQQSYLAPSLTPTEVRFI